MKGRFRFFIIDRIWIGQGKYMFWDGGKNNLEIEIYKESLEIVNGFKQGIEWL